MTDDLATSETASEHAGEQATPSPEPATEPEVGLHRSNTNKVVAGVAGGLGDRFEIDPNIVRVIFVVLTVLWGLGAAIYLAMWVLIPRSAIGRDVVAVEKLPVSKSRWVFYALLAAVVVLAAIVIASTAGAPQVGRGLALLWFIFLIVIAILALRTPVSRLNLRRVVAVLFLLGVSVVIVLSGIFFGFLASTGVPLEGSTGARAWQPATMSQVQHEYRVEFGSGVVDLANVTFPKNGYSIAASVAVGDLTIVVPADAVVEMRTHTGLGSVSYSSTYPNYYGYYDGSFNGVPKADTTVALQRAAPHVSIDAQVGIGQIYLARSSSTRSPAPIKPASATAPSVLVVP